MKFDIDDPEIVRAAEAAAAYGVRSLHEWLSAWPFFARILDRADVADHITYLEDMDFLRAHPELEDELPF